MEIIVISAVWCPSCLILNKNLNKLMSEMDIKVKKLDYDLDEDLVSQYQVGDTLPVIIYKDKRLVGEHTYEEIKEFLNEKD